jgi:hypothetical protein
MHSTDGRWYRMSQYGVIPLGNPHPGMNAVLEPGQCIECHGSGKAIYEYAMGSAVIPCTDCFGSGLNPEARKLARVEHIIDELWDQSA